MNLKGRGVPYMMQRFRKLPGTYGSLDIVAKSRDVAEFQLTQEFFQMNRTDAQELVRVLSEWLALPGDTQVVRTDGQRSELIVVDHGAGTPSITIVDGNPPEGTAASPRYVPAPDMLPHHGSEPRPHYVPAPDVLPHRSSEQGPHYEGASDVPSRRPT